MLPPGRPLPGNLTARQSTSAVPTARDFTVTTPRSQLIDNSGGEIPTVSIEFTGLAQEAQGDWWNGLGLEEDGLCFRDRIEGREAKYGELERALTHPLCCAVKSVLGISKFYRHQALAIDSARNGDNVVICTGTASGMLCISPTPCT